MKQIPLAVVWSSWIRFSWAILIFGKSGNPNWFSALFCFKDVSGNCHILFLDVSLTWSIALSNSSTCFKFLSFKGRQKLVRVLWRWANYYLCRGLNVWSVGLQNAVWHNLLAFFTIDIFYHVSWMLFSSTYTIYKSFCFSTSSPVSCSSCSHCLLTSSADFRKRQCYPLLMLNLRVIL